MKRNNRRSTYLLPVITIAVLFAIGGCRVFGAGGSSGSNGNDESDTTAPTVTLTVPTDSATGVAINSTITATFSEVMDSTTITDANFTLAADSTSVAGTVTYNADLKTAAFAPDSNLDVSTTYTATVTTGVTNEAGTALEEARGWTFTTGTEANTTAPTVVSTVPSDDATGVAVTTNITATFSEAMNPATIVAANFTLANGSSPVSGTVTYDIPNTAAIFAPDSNLTEDTTYTATVTTGVTDEAGNALAANEIWTFTTAAAGLGPAPVNLGTAGNYVVLAKSTVTNDPTSAITGNIGLSPAATSFLTGFSHTLVGTYATSDQVTGSLFAADMDAPTGSNLTTAVQNMEAAYTDAAGRSGPDFQNLESGDIGGETLAPGLYNWGSTVTIPSGITISGAANDVWIFQMTGDLSVSSGVIVTLEGGAQAKNIFWQVAGQATIGTTAQFEGIILSATSITIGTGASMNGRALAQSAVGLNANTLVEPTQ